MKYHMLADQQIRLFASTGKKRRVLAASVVFAKLDISAFSAVWFVGYYCKTWIRTSKRRQK